MISLAADPSANERIETPTRLELSDPATGQPIVIDGAPAYIMVYSAHSETFKRRNFHLTNRLSAQVKRRGQSELRYEDNATAVASVIAAAIGEEWRIGRKRDGAWTLIDVPCTPENALQWVQENPLFRPQILAASEDLAAFLADRDSFTPAPSNG